MRVKVGDDMLDSFRDEVIAQSYSVNQIGDIASRQGGFSNDFELPLTAKNSTILGVPQDLNSGTAKPYQKVSASLIDQGAVVAEGYLRYNNVVDNKINVSFFSDNVEWFSLLKDKSIRELDLSALDHKWDIAVQATAINADKSSGYTYPIIDYGEFGNVTTLDVDGDQLYPAVFINTIVEQIFFEIGWKAEGAMIDLPLFQRMIIPFSGESFSQSTTYIEDNTISIYQPADQTQNVTNGGNSNFEIIWTLPSTAILTPITIPGDYTISFNANVITNQSGGGFIVLIVVNNVSVAQTQVNYIPNYEGPTSISYTQFLLPDDEIYILFSTAPPFPVDYTVSDGVLTFTPSENIAYGADITIANILPDIKQSDLIKYLVFITGAIPQANNFSKTVTFSLFREIKNNLNSALDWSNKIDMSKSRDIDFRELLDNYYSNSILTYLEDDNDNELKAYKAETGQIFGQGSINISNEHISGKDTIYEAPFSSMINILSFDDTMYIPQIRFKVPGGDDLTPTPKIAILSENISVEDLSLGVHSELRLYDPTNVYMSTVACPSIPFCWFVKTQYITAIDALLDSLTFDQVAFANAIGDPLIERFLEDYEDILNEIKYAKAFFHLNETDINALDFTIPVYVDHYKSYFYISKIKDYQGSHKTTECELVRIADG